MEWENLHCRSYFSWIRKAGDTSCQADSLKGGLVECSRVPECREIRHSGTWGQVLVRKVGLTGRSLISSFALLSLSVLFVLVW